MRVYLNCFFRWNDEELNSTDGYKAVIDKWRAVVQSRRLDCWQPFKDFDRHNRGHVTPKQFVQAIAILNLPFGAADIAVLEAKFRDDTGFNYLRFLNELQPNVIDPPKYFAFQQELAALNAQKATYEPSAATDVQSILAKIRDQVWKRRVSIYEWLRDHDKLNAGRIAKETFRRAFNLCNLEVAASEIEILVN